MREVKLRHLTSLQEGEGAMAGCQGAGEMEGSCGCAPDYPFSSHEHVLTSLHVIVIPWLQVAGQGILELIGVEVGKGLDIAF